MRANQPPTTIGHRSQETSPMLNEDSTLPMRKQKHDFPLFSNKMEYQLFSLALTPSLSIYGALS